jgi:hypothetical protein
VIKPCGDVADYLLSGRDPVREEHREDAVAVNATTCTTSVSRWTRTSGASSRSSGCLAFRGSGLAGDSVRAVAMGAK